MAFTENLQGRVGSYTSMFIMICWTAVPGNFSAFDILKQ